MSEISLTKTWTLGATRLTSRLFYDSTRNGLGNGRGGCFSPPFLWLWLQGGVSFQIYILRTYYLFSSKRYLLPKSSAKRRVKPTRERDASHQFYICLLKIWLTFSISLFFSKIWQISRHKSGYSFRLENSIAFKAMTAMDSVKLGWRPRGRQLGAKRFLAAWRTVLWPLSFWVFFFFFLVFISTRRRNDFPLPSVFIADFEDWRNRHQATLFKKECLLCSLWCWLLLKDCQSKTDDDVNRVTSQPTRGFPLVAFLWHLSPKKGLGTGSCADSRSCWGGGGRQQKKKKQLPGAWVCCCRLHVYKDEQIPSNDVIVQVHSRFFNFFTLVRFTDPRELANN